MQRNKTLLSIIALPLGIGLLFFALGGFSVFSEVFAQTSDPGPGFVIIDVPAPGEVITTGTLNASGTAGGARRVINDCPETEPKTFIWEWGQLLNPAFTITSVSSGTVVSQGSMTFTQTQGTDPGSYCGNGSDGQLFLYDWDLNTDVSSLADGDYTLRVEAENTLGNFNFDEVGFTVTASGGGGGGDPVPAIQVSVVEVDLTYFGPNESDSNLSTSFLASNQGTAGSTMNWQGQRSTVNDKPWLVLGENTTGSNLESGDSRIATVIIDPRDDQDEPQIEFGVNEAEIIETCFNYVTNGPACRNDDEFPNPIKIPLTYSIDLQVDLTAQ